MVRFRIRLRSRKSKKWKHGHSSSTNPECKKHRTLANQSSNSTCLSEAGLSFLKDRDPDFDMETDSVSTFQTWVSSFTDCSNSSFDQVKRRLKANSELSDQIVIVLSTVTEIIKQKQCEGTDSEYFACLVTTLEAVDKTSTLTATLYLMSLVIRKTSLAILQSKFSDLATIVCKILDENYNSNETLLLKSCLQCFTHLFKVQPLSVWNDDFTIRMFKSVYPYVTHAKPRVRRAAQTGITIILRDPDLLKQHTAHPVSSSVAMFCVAQIEEIGMSDEIRLLYTLGLMKNIISCVKSSTIVSLCECLLKLMTAASSLVKVTCMQVLNNLFTFSVSDVGLDANINCKLINALYDYQPNVNDQKTAVTWIIVLRSAHISLFQYSSELCRLHLPRFFNVGLKFIQSNHEQVKEIVEKSLIMLIRTCMHFPKVDDDIQRICLQKLIDCLTNGLMFRYRDSWSHILSVFSQMFINLNEEHFSVVEKSLKEMGKLKSSDNFECERELSEAICRAITAFGPHHVLQCIPLNITGDELTCEFPQSWLLPLLAKSVRNTNLSFFIENLLPLALKLKGKVESCHDKALANSFDMLQDQIWSTLPGFCNDPRDLLVTFPLAAKGFGNMLLQRRDIASYVLRALRNLIKSTDANDDARSEIGKYARNFLPILFNMYLADDKDSDSSIQKSVLQTVKSYLKITDRNLVCKFYNKCIEKYAEKNDSSCSSILDLLMYFIPYSNADMLTKGLALVLPNLQNSSKRALQKRSFRILEEICYCSSEESMAFVENNFSIIKNALFDSCSSSVSSSRNSRLRCFINLFDYPCARTTDFIKFILPEVVLSLKEMNVRARRSAATLLLKCCRIWCDISKLDEASSMQQFFHLNMCGLVGNVQLVCCSCLALARLIFEFKELLSGELIKELMEAMILLVKNEVKSIAVHALAALKVLIGALNQILLAPYLSRILDALTHMKEVNNVNAKMKTKMILTRLMKKFDYVTIASKLPEGFKKQLLNIKKSLAREERHKNEKKRNKSTKDDETFSVLSKPKTVDELLEDSDSCSDSESSHSTVKTRKKVWISESSGEPLDLLDPVASQHILASCPTRKNKKGQRKTDFDVGDDGRIIITDEDETQTNRKEKDSEAKEDIEDLMKTLSLGKHKRSWRPRDYEEFSDDDEDEISITTKSAQKVRKKQPKLEPGAEFRSKKARGDIKKKGKPDPYAYIQLNTQVLNRRKRAKHKDQFKNIIRKARIGAIGGSKVSRKPHRR